MKRKTVGFILAMMCLTLTPAAVYAEAENVQTAEETQSTENDLSDNLYDFQMKIGDEVYQFPMYYEDFVARGWTLGKNDDPSMGIGTNSYGSVTFYKGENRVYASALNLGINEIPLDQCLIAGIDLDGSYDFDLENIGVELPGGIVMGTSNADDIQKAYGSPSDTYEGDLYTKYSYEKDIYEEVNLYVYKDSNTLKKVEMRNFAEPEGYDKGSVSDEIPEIVTAYTAPTELGQDILEPQVEYCGDLYTLPAPLSAFIENGWEMQDVSDDAYVAGRDLEFIDIMRDNQTVHISVYNFTENATAIENCFVKSLDVATYDGDAITLKLSGDITLGTKKADLIAAAEAKGYLYSEDGDYLNIYKTADTKIDHRIQCWFNADEDPETVASVEYRKETLDE